MTIKEFDMHDALGTLDTAISIEYEEKQIAFGGGNVAESEYFPILKIDGEEYNAEDYSWTLWTDVVEQWPHDSISVNVDRLRTILIDTGILT